MRGTLPGSTGINHANLLQHFSYRSFGRGHAVEDSQLIASKYFRTLPEFENAKEKAKIGRGGIRKMTPCVRSYLECTKATHFSSNRLSAYGVEICFPPSASKNFYSQHRQPPLKGTGHAFNGSIYLQGLGLGVELLKIFPRVGAMDSTAQYICKGRG